MKLGHYIACVIISCLAFSCGKGGCNVVPNVSFSKTISQASHPKIYAPGGWAYADGGACGLILYNNNGTLIAYDRCSTVDVGARNQVVVDGFIVEDKVSGAKWLLLDGSPSHIAECSLKPYRTSQNGAFYTVYN